MSVFGKNIRFLRKKAALSQADLARTFGYKSYTTIQKWEAGQAFPPIPTCLKLAAFFAVSLEDLMQADLEASGRFTSSLAVESLSCTSENEAEQAHLDATAAEGKEAYRADS